MAAPTAEAIAQAQPVSTHKWAVAMAVMLGAFLQRVDTSIVNVALPYMQESFATGVEQISWVVTSYLVALSIMIPLSGWASATTPVTRSRPGVTKQIVMRPAANCPTLLERRNKPRETFERFHTSHNINRAKPASGYRGRCGTSQRFHVLSLF